MGELGREMQVAGSAEGERGVVDDEPEPCCCFKANIPRAPPPRLPYTPTRLLFALNLQPSTLAAAFSSAARQPLPAAPAFFTQPNYDLIVRYGASQAYCQGDGAFDGRAVSASTRV